MGSTPGHMSCGRQPDTCPPADSCRCLHTLSTAGRIPDAVTRRRSPPPPVTATTGQHHLSPSPVQRPHSQPRVRFVSLLRQTLLRPGSGVEECPPGVTVVVGMGAARFDGAQYRHLCRHGSHRVLSGGLVVEGHDEDLVVLVGEVDADAFPAGRHGRVHKAVDGCPCRYGVPGEARGPERSGGSSTPGPPPPPPPPMLPVSGVTPPRWAGHGDGGALPFGMRTAVEVTHVRCSLCGAFGELSWTAAGWTRHWPAPEVTSARCTRARTSPRRSGSCPMSPSRRPTAATSPSGSRSTTPGTRCGPAARSRAAGW